MRLVANRNGRITIGLSTDIRQKSGELPWPHQVGNFLGPNGLLVGIYHGPRHDLTDGMDKRAAFEERQLQKTQDANYANFLIALNKSDLNMKDVAKYARDLHMRVDLASKNKEIGVEHYIFILEAIKRMGQGDYQNSPLFGKLHHRKYADDLLMRAELALRNKGIGCRGINYICLICWQKVPCDFYWIPILQETAEHRLCKATGPACLSCHYVDIMDF